MGELLMIPKIVNEIRKGIHHRKQFMDALSGLMAHDVADMAESYREAYRNVDARYTRLVDKMPHNFEQLGLIALMFPKAHVIHCRRNPLDTCVSVYMQSYMNKHSYAQDLGTLGRYYRNYADLMEHWQQVLPLPIHDCVYEEMIGDFEGSLKSMLSFLGLEWDPGCLEFHQRDGRVRTASNWQVRQPLYDKSIGRWRHYRKHIGPLAATLGTPEVAEEAGL
jgi:hypothetical protein